MKPERLDVDEKWYCSQCKAHVQADKKLDLWSFPEVLVLQLKRFAYGRSLSDKLTARVDFPLRGLALESLVCVARDPHSFVHACLSLKPSLSHSSVRLALAGAQFPSSGLPIKFRFP